MLRILTALLLAAAAYGADGWADLFNGRNLDGWEIIGTSVWSVTKEGVLVGQRDLEPALKHAPFLADAKEYRAWLYNQSWLYTKRNDFGEFDLHVEYLLR